MFHPSRSSIVILHIYLARNYYQNSLANKFRNFFVQESETVEEPPKSPQEEKSDIRPGEEWQKRFGSATKTGYEARPVSRLRSTIKETTEAIQNMASPQVIVFMTSLVNYRILRVS